MFSGSEAIGLRDAAEILGVGPRRAAALLSSARIEGRKLSPGVWITTPDAVRRYMHNTRPGKGRTLAPATAWGVLWELSGLRPTWLPASTHSRVRTHIATSNAEQLVRADAGRTSVSYYEAGDSDTARQGLILTGRAAAKSLGMFKNDRFSVVGYVRDGTPHAHAATAGMVPVIGGKKMLFTNTLPIEYAEQCMPKAVVAADLARTSDARGRAQALVALELLRREWIKTR